MHEEGPVRQLGWDDVAGRIGWLEVVDALEAGHRLPAPELGDTFLRRGDDTLLSRAAWVPGLGMAVKTVTVLPGNAARGVPTVQGGVLVFADDDGRPEAIIDGRLVTWWKTAADSALCARYLARPDSRVLLVIGAGVVARSLVPAHRAVLPAIDTVLIWSRTHGNAAALADELRADGHPTTAVRHLPDAVRRADVISTATTSSEPVLDGSLLRAGTHVDLVGAYAASMREADDQTLLRGSVFVDCRATTLHDIGELRIPLRSGVLTEADVRGELRDLVGGAPGRTSPEEITVCKNGGGAHLDLMTCRALLAAAHDRADDGF
jgi:ornithine cyclodeaminase